MPNRMWKHGIYNFIDLLQRNSPHSKEYMLQFTFIAYSMMALLYETVPAFEKTWKKYLDDLGYFLMKIEFDQPHRKDW